MQHAGFGRPHSSPVVHKRQHTNRRQSWCSQQRDGEHSAHTPALVPNPCARHGVRFGGVCSLLDVSSGGQGRRGSSACRAGGCASPVCAPAVAAAYLARWHFDAERERLDAWASRTRAPRHRFSSLTLMLLNTTRRARALAPQIEGHYHYGRRCHLPQGICSKDAGGALVRRCYCILSTKCLQPKLSCPKDLLDTLTKRLVVSGSACMTLTDAMRAGPGSPFMLHAKER